MDKLTAFMMSEVNIMGKRNSKDLKAKMRGRWLGAFSCLAPTLCAAIDELGMNVPCPVSGGTDGFRLFRDANETGGGVKQSYRVFPEGIDLLMWVNDWSFTKVFDELEAFIGGKSIDTSQIASPFKILPTIVNEEGLRTWLNTLWSESLPLAHEMAHPARAYFRMRWLSQAAGISSDIRYHRKLYYRDKMGKEIGSSGAIISLVRNNEGEPVAIHRTFITPWGEKSVFGNKLSAKTMTPSVNKKSRGRHIQLFTPQKGFIGIAEGLETALAVYQAKAFPVWPCLSATMLQSFVPPKGVHTVLNFVDKDRNKAGEYSAKIIRGHLEPQGINVIDLLPPIPLQDFDKKGVDWADQLMREPEGFNMIDKIICQKFDTCAQ